MRSVYVVAKGKSAERLVQNIGRDDHVACINDSAILLPDRHVEWVFFSDLFRAKEFTSFAHRVERFVSRELLDEEVGDLPAPIREKWIVYRDRLCAGDIQSLADKIVSGGVAHHSTVPAAIHWLCKYGHYREMHVIGVDGGGEYAHGVTDDHLCDLALWRIIARRTALLCSRIYDTHIRWSDESDDSGKSI